MLAAEEPSPAAVAGYDAYVGRVEARLRAEHQRASGYLAPEDWTRLRQGEPIVEKLSQETGAELPGAMLSDRRGTAFVPGGRVRDFERVMRNFREYPRIYAPQVQRASMQSQNGDHNQVTLRTEQKHVLTVVLDTSYDVSFGRLDSQHGYSVSRSTHVAEIEAAGKPSERALSPAEQHGFLWRMNTYWSYEERDGGLYIQIETVTLTRSVPKGLGWAVGPFIESVPRESMEFTLAATREALKR